MGTADAPRFVPAGVVSSDSIFPTLRTPVRKTSSVQIPASVPATAHAGPSNRTTDGTTKRTTTTTSRAAEGAADDSAEEAELKAPAASTSSEPNQAAPAADQQAEDVPEPSYSVTQNRIALSLAEVQADIRILRNNLEFVMRTQARIWAMLGGGDL